MMLEIINNVKISLRKDDLSSWTRIDPVLQNGEIAIAVDQDGNENIKIGNGLSSFSQLSFLNQNMLKSDFVQAGSVTTKHISQGYSVKSTPTSMATGVFTEADGNFDVVHGIEAKALSTDNYAFVFNGVNFPDSIAERYTSHGEGSFSINPKYGLSGLYIGEVSLADSHYTRAQTDEIYMSRFNAEAVIHDYIQYRVVPEISSIQNLSAEQASIYDIACKLNEFLEIARVKWATTIGTILSVDPETVTLYDVSTKFNEILMVLKDETR